MKIGLIGCGKQAPKHITCLKKVSGVEVVVCDINEDRARAVADSFDLKWTKSPADLLSDPDVVALDVATPTPTHVELVTAALENGKHFFCEKPLSESLDQAREIEALAATKDRIGMVGYVYRYAPIFETGRELVADRDTRVSVLGDPITAWFRIGGRGDHELWKHRKETGGGAKQEMMVHMLDLAIWYFGPVRTATVIADDLLRPVRRIAGQDVSVDAEDFVLIRLTMESGLNVLVEADLLTPAFCQYVEIQFERGSFMGSIQADMPSYVFATEDTPAYRSGKTKLDFGHVNLFERQMAAFCECARTGSMPDRNSLKDSLLVMETLEMLRSTEVNR